MIENIEHHIEEEEGDMFVKARQVFDRAELEQLGEAMAERKQEAQAAEAASSAR
jgi:hemerythrin-like domain-containing protein